MEVRSSIDWREYTSRSSDWTRRTAPMALAILFERLKKMAGPICYGELAIQMYRRYGEPVQYNKQKYGWPLGAAAHAAIRVGKEHGMKVPPLSVIVIREDSGYPGTGADQFVRALRGKEFEREDPKRLAILDRAASGVWGFGTDQWERLEQLVGLPPLPMPRAVDKDLGAPPKVGRKGGGEKPAHAALKKWVADHPDHFKEFGHYLLGRNEELLQSGDSIDAMLSGPTTRLAVEVKASNATDDELIRGIFQCVKYRATLEAESRAYPSTKLPGTSILVSTNGLSPKAQAIAALFDVSFRRVSMRCEV